ADIVHSIAFSLDGSRLASVGGDVVIVWDIPGRKQQCRYSLSKVNDTHAGKPVAVVPEPRLLAFSPDGQTVLAACHGYTRRFSCDAAGGKAPQVTSCKTPQADRTFNPPELRWAALAFAPDGKTLAALHESEELKLWDIGTGQLMGGTKVKGMQVTH